MVSEAHPPEPPIAAAPAVESRRQRQRQEARRAILDAAEALAIESGGTDFSIRGLAKRSGYSAPTVYHYFGDKDGLIEALIDERISRLADELDRVARRPDPLDDLLATLRAYVAFSAANPTFSRLMWTVSRKGESRTPPSMERLRGRIGTAIHALAAAGRLGDLDAETAGQMLWALLRGLTALQVTEPDHPWSPDLAERSLETLFRGMTHSPAPLEK